MVARLSNNECKQLASLKTKKYRSQQKLFLVEGEKLVEEALKSHIPVKAIVALDSWWQAQPRKLEGITCLTASPQQIKQLSLMVTPPPVVAVVHIPNYQLNIKELQQKITLALENIQDPGNLGTIIRIADWYGIDHVICSHESVEAFNPKVIQSSMGSIFRVKVHYNNLIQFCKETGALQIPLVGTFLEGENMYTARLPASGVLVMGNESKGISDELAKLIEKRVTIPSINASQVHAESLNVAMATAIVCSEWMRKIHWSAGQ